MERWGLGITNCRPVKSVVSGVVEAEELGAEIAFIAEDVNCRDSFELCAVAATATQRIRLATGVVNPYTRNPTSLAMAIATLDELSDGRAVLGMGTSSPALIRDQMGIDPGKTATVMRETTTIVRGLLSGERVTFSGQRFSYVDAELEASPVQERILIFFAAMGPNMLHLAGRIADGVLLNVGASTEYIRWATREIEKGAAVAGRNMDEITIAAWLTVYVTEEYESGVERAREWLAGMLSIPRQGELLLEHAGLDASYLGPIREQFQAYPHRGDRATAARCVPREYAEKLALIGTPEQVADRVLEYREAGVQVPVLGIAALRAILTLSEKDR